MSKKTLSATALALLSVGLMGATGYDNAKPSGFLNYEDPVRTVRKPAPKPKEPASAPVVQPQAEVPKEEKRPEMGSVEWLRENLPKLRDRAINNPTYENVRAHMYAERLMLDKASNFTYAREEVLRRDPFLDESVRFPIAVAARSQALYQVEQAKRDIISDVTGKAGLWMFFDASCRFCHTQFGIMKMLEEKYPKMEVRYITKDGKLIKGMDPGKIYIDQGGAKARRFGLQLTPAVMLVVPSTNSFAVVSHGAMSLDELEQKLVTAAVDLKIADDKLTDLANLQRRGIISAKEMKKMQEEFGDTDDPEKLVQVMNRILGGKLSQ